mmetsp:Transcript_9852/g.22751  ORF Transcript_9852/g.22751 Transcript_9852/m.22751 type:complete len:223 (+) Transcript_9852:1-669(+)
MGGAGGAEGPERLIGMTALYQARAGGNRAMIATAERYLVTNPEVTIKGRSALTAPWHKSDTRGFLRQAADLRREAAARDTADAAARGWRTAIEANLKRKEAERIRDREEGVRLERELEHRSLDKELRRACLINAIRSKLNEDLLRVAEMARVAVADGNNSNNNVANHHNRGLRHEGANAGRRPGFDHDLPAVEAHNVFLEDDATLAARANALEALARELSLS